MASQFFFRDSSNDKSVADIAAGINANTQFETEQANREDELRRKQALNKIFSSHINGEGNLDNQSFYQMASEAGLAPEQIREAMKHREAQLATMRDIANTKTATGSLGFDIADAGRNNAGFGAPDGGSILPGMQKIASPSAGGLTGQGSATQAQIASNNALVAGLRNPNDVGASQAETVEPAPETVAPVAPAPVAPVEPAVVSPVTTAKDRYMRMLKGSKQEIKAAQKELGVTADGKVGPATRTAMDLVLGKMAKVEEAKNTFATEEGGQVAVTAPFQSAGEEAKMVPDTVGPDIFAPAPSDNRSFDQKFEDSYNQQNTLGAGGAGGAGGLDNATFDWAPENDPSSEFSQYKTTIDSRLKATKYGSAGEFLKQVYTYTFQSNMPTAPNEGLLMLGKEGIAKYNGEMKAYQAGLLKAKGLAMAEVDKAKTGLIEDAKAYGTNLNEAETHKLDVEAKNADIGGRRAGTTGMAGISRTRNVSPTEKTDGDRMSLAYQDFKASNAQGGFEGAMGMAKAVGKADGQFNRDTMMADLVAMGEVPSDQARYIKDLLSEGGSSITDEGIKQAKAYMAKQIVKVNPNKRNAWIKAKLANILDGMQGKGYGLTPAKADTSEKTGAAKKINPKPKADPLGIF